MSIKPPTFVTGESVTIDKLVAVLADLGIAADPSDIASVTIDHVGLTAVLYLRDDEGRRVIANDEAATVTYVTPIDRSKPRSHRPPEATCRPEVASPA